MKTEPAVRAISIVVYDPSGKTTGETFPPGSVWMLDKERAERRRAARSDGRKKAPLTPLKQHAPVQKVNSTVSGTKQN